MDYNQQFSDRTKSLALKIIKLYDVFPKKEPSKIIGRQLLRSATSVAANYRAVRRARSEAERFSKLSIVVEEVDETMFWLEIIEESNLIDAQIIAPLKQECFEILKVMSAYRARIKSKIKK